MDEKQSRGIGKGTPGPGRKKGVPNKNTTALKEMILGALDKAGGVEYLQRQAEENPGPFLALVGKVLPLTVAGDPDNPQRVEFVTTYEVRPSVSSSNAAGTKSGSTRRSSGPTTIN